MSSRLFVFDWKNLCVFLCVIWEWRKLKLDITVCCSHAMTANTAPSETSVRTTELHSAKVESLTEITLMNESWLNGCMCVFRGCFGKQSALSMARLLLQHLHWRSRGVPWHWLFTVPQGRPTSHMLYLLWCTFRKLTDLFFHYSPFIFKGENSKQQSVCDCEQ